MVVKRRQIWVEEEDLNILRIQIKNLLLKQHPELEGMYITDRYLFRQVIMSIIENEKISIENGQ